MRVDFGWMLDERTGLLHMGWDPDKGLLRAEWAAYYSRLSFTCSAWIPCTPDSCYVLVSF